MSLDQVHEQLLNNFLQEFGPKEAMNQLARLAGYKTSPVDIHTFLNDTDYLGAFLGEGHIFSIWDDALREIFPNPFHSPCLSIMCGGSIGQGKTTFGCAGFLYDLHKILCLDNPQKFFSLLDFDIILFAVLNATRTLAEDVIMDKLMGWMLHSPFFKPHLVKQAKLRRNNKRATMFPNNIDLDSGSRFDQMMGRHVISFIMDESNFQDRIKDQAKDNFNALMTRMESRFLGKGNTYPAHIWLLSSQSDETGWLSQKMEEARGKSHTRVYEFAIWDALKDKQPCPYGGEKFKVFIGDQIRDPFVISVESDMKGIEEHLIIDVPVEYKERFETDPNVSLRDLAGVGTWTTRKFIPSIELIQECQIRENPVTRTELQLSFYDPEDHIIDYLLFDKIEQVNLPRFIHIDLGITGDRTGLASIRYAGMVTVTKFEKQFQKYVSVKEPIFYVDFILYIKARGGEEVPIGKIKAFLEHLRRRGYKIAGVSMDGYQSIYLRQELALIGFEAEELSVDKKRDAYDNLKNLILESRLNCVKHPILDHELRNLIDTGKKIDHPQPRDKYFKDGSDALAGACWNAFLKIEEVYGLLYSPNEYLDALEKHFKREEESSLLKMFKEGDKVGNIHY